MSNTTRRGVLPLMSKTSKAGCSQLLFAMSTTIMRSLHLAPLPPSSTHCALPLHLSPQPPAAEKPRLAASRTGVGMAKASPSLQRSNAAGVRPAAASELASHLGKTRSRNAARSNDKLSTAPARDGRPPEAAAVEGADGQMKASWHNCADSSCCRPWQAVALVKAKPKNKRHGPAPKVGAGRMSNKGGHIVSTQTSISGTLSLATSPPSSSVENLSD
mmetsp:Transcript_27189/g.78134  ORF Transcript_27189/g.78134 Transcript_27189/m.78134 type:complete len:217 (-) Transcript_27189:390-1040(-)